MVSGLGRTFSVNITLIPSIPYKSKMAYAEEITFRDALQIIDIQWVTTKKKKGA